MASSSASISNSYRDEFATLIWTIDDFVRVNRVMSPVFSPPDSNNRFKLVLSFGTENKAQILFYYWEPNEESRSALFCYHYAILDANGEKHHSREHLWDYNMYLRWRSFDPTYYISRDECDKFLVNGSLNIYCAVMYSYTVSALPPEIKLFRKLLANYETLLESGKWSDFVVQIGDKQFRVHKNILGTRSAVFATMFEREETQEVKEGRLVVEDVKVDVFELVLRYIYTGKVDGLGEHTAELYVAADKYQLDDLRSFCEQSLMITSCLTVESVCSVLLLSDMHKAEQLKSKCIEYIMERAKIVMQTQGWKQLVKSNRIDLVAELCEKLANKVE